MLVKRWSEAESFTIFENHVYQVKKSYVCKKIGDFLLWPTFWRQLRILHHVMLHM
jgi:hypothetical protein